MTDSTLQNDDPSLLGGAADEPKADEPKADAPKADEPKADEPKADEPKADELTLDAEPGEEPLRDKIVALGKELKLDKDSAVKVQTLVKETVAAREAVMAEEFKNQVKEWADTVRADPDLGGAKLRENLGVAAKAIDAFGGKELREILDATGLGNHPVLVKAFVQIGKAIADDRLAGGGAGGTQQRDARSLYPNSNMN